MTITQYTLPELLELLDVTPRQLAKAADISEGAVYRNLDMSPDGLKTHDTTANAIAAALGVNKHEIRWPRGTSQVGRNAGDHTVTRDTTCQQQKMVPRTELCSTCFTTLPKVGTCGYCT